MTDIDPPAEPASRAPSGLELATYRFPGDRPVLLIHGITRSARLDWVDPGWPEALGRVGRGAIAVDLPGHGARLPVTRSDVSFGNIVAAMVAAIDATEQHQADVVGYSLGARFAWALAATGRVRRVVLGGLSPTDPMADLDVELLGAVVRGEVESPEPQLARLASWINQPHLDRDATLALVDALADAPFDPAVDIPTVPTLIAAGADDTPLDQLAADIPSATHVVVPGDHIGALMSMQFRSESIRFLT